MVTHKKDSDSGGHYLMSLPGIIPVNEAIFESWVQFMTNSGAMKKSSATVYASMWKRLLVHADKAGIEDISTCPISDIELVIRNYASDSDTSYPRRLAQLVARVLSHYFAHDESNQDKLKLLSKLPPKFKDVRAYVPSFIQKGEGVPDLSKQYQKSKENKIHWPSLTWKSKRDLAIAAVALFAGLKLEEITQLYLEQLHYDVNEDQYTIEIKGSKKRMVPMNKIGNTYLSEWIKELGVMIPGYLDKTRARKAFISTSSGTPISRVTVYRSIKEVFNQSRSGSATAARNTFAIESLVTQHADTSPHAKKLVAEWLGYRRLDSLDRFMDVDSLMNYISLNK